MLSVKLSGFTVYGLRLTSLRLPVQKKREPADKPGSVIGQPFIWDDCHQPPLAAYPDATRATSMHPYLALLQVGFTVP